MSADTDLKYELLARNDSGWGIARNTGRGTYFMFKPPYTRRQAISPEEAMSLIQLKIFVPTAVEREFYSDEGSIARALSEKNTRVTRGSINAAREYMRQMPASWIEAWLTEADSRWPARDTDLKRLERALQIISRLPVVLASVALSDRVSQLSKRLLNRRCGSSHLFIPRKLPPSGNTKTFAIYSVYNSRGRRENG